MLRDVKIRQREFSRVEKEKIAFFCKWRWKPDMTMMEGMDCLDDSFLGVEALLQNRQSAGNHKQSTIKKSPGQSRIV
jgi:hypothetical protein